jgi:hypothetical protein
MKKIPIEYDYEAQVDDEDYEFLSTYRWKISRNNQRGDTVYAKTKIETLGKLKSVGMHRMVIGDAYQEWPKGVVPLEVILPNGKALYFLHSGNNRCRKMTVDHIDCNGLNNQRSNLRHASCSEQSKNRRRKGG